MTGYQTNTMQWFYFLGQLRKLSAWRLPPTVENLSGGKCQTSTDWIPRMLLQLPLVPGPRVSLEWIPRPWQTVGPISGPSPVDSSLAFCKEIGSSWGVTPSLVRWHRHVWWTDASRKRTSRVRARRKPSVSLGLVSHLGPVRHEWLYRIALRIIDIHKPYHDDNVGTQLAGNAMVCYCIVLPSSKWAVEFI